MWILNTKAFVNSNVELSGENTDLIGLQCGYWIPVEKKGEDKVVFTQK